MSINLLDNKVSNEASQLNCHALDCGEIMLDELQPELSRDELITYELSSRQKVLAQKINDKLIVPQLTGGSSERANRIELPGALRT